jgi:hypothetical protein
MRCEQLSEAVTLLVAIVLRRNVSDRLCKSCRCLVSPVHSPMQLFERRIHGRHAGRSSESDCAR